MKRLNFSHYSSSRSSFLPYTLPISLGSEVITQTQLVSMCTHFLCARELVCAISLGAGDLELSFAPKKCNMTTRRWRDRVYLDKCNMTTRRWRDRVYLDKCHITTRRWRDRVYLDKCHITTRRWRDRVYLDKCDITTRRWRDRVYLDKCDPSHRNQPVVVSYMFLFSKFRCWCKLYDRSAIQVFTQFKQL